jgi:hypothetical protein
VKIDVVIYLRVVCLLFHKLFWRSGSKKEGEFQYGGKRVGGMNGMGDLTTGSQAGFWAWTPKGWSLL